MADGSDRRETRRLSGEERREEILAAAGRALADQGYLPVPVEQVAREAGASKALVYAYFKRPADLYNTLLERGLASLDARLARAKRSSFESRSVEGALVYFDEVADHGAQLHLLLTDAYLNEARSRHAVLKRDEIWLRFLRASRSYVSLAPQDRVAALAMILAVPEELGRLAHRGELARDRARDLCGQLVLSALRGLREDSALRL